MTEGIESRDEYLISRALLIHFLTPKKIIDKIIGGVEFVESIIKFLEGRVFIHEDKYCYYLKMSLKHHGVYTNNGVEGLQNGVRHSTTGVTATTSLPLATERICDGDLHATMRKAHDISKNSRSVIANTSSLTSNFVSSATEKQIEVSIVIPLPTACL